MRYHLTQKLLLLERETEQEFITTKNRAISIAKLSVTVESSYNGTGCNGIPPITEAILRSLEKIFFISYI